MSDGPAVVSRLDCTDVIESGHSVGCSATSTLENANRNAPIIAMTPFQGIGSAKREHSTSDWKQIVRFEIGAVPGAGEVRRDGFVF
jgi:hypothetical protein